jgi:pyruvate/2-oxoglutarate dehydrogenase complex dihydrolipoamide acyltransferase (E2) component
VIYELKLPDVGEGVAEGEIVRWLMTEGQAVREDDPLVEVLTDKADVEIPSPVSGVLTKIVAQPGQVVKVGNVVALIEYAGPKARPAQEQGADVPPPAAPSRPAPPPAPSAGADVLATPAVRKLARDLGVDLGAVAGSGPGGRITEADVRAVSGGGARPDAGHLLEERIPFRGKRRMAAKKMVQAKTTVPHALVVDEADATELLALRGRMREVAAREGVKITILPFVIQAVVSALRAHPAMNASLDEAAGQVVLKKHYDIGIAVDAEDGLVVPVVRDAGEKTVVELAREVERLSEAVRAGSVALSDVSGSTFTITSVGSIGGLFSYPVINIPDAGILGVHKVVKRPVVREGSVAVRDMVYLSLSFDHRIVDGGTATRFMNDVIRLIESPSWEEPS